MATRDQDRRRRAAMRRNGPTESFTVAEIGERDGWLCGICLDPAHLVEQLPAMQVGEIPIEALVAEDVPPEEEVPEEVRPLARRPLSASIDHIVPIAKGGSHTRENVQIAHLFCNIEKNSSDPDSRWVRPEYVRALLAQRVDGIPIPEGIHRACSPSWAYPASRRVEYMIALLIAIGDMAADPRYGDPATRLDPFVRELGAGTIRESLTRMRERRRRQSVPGSLPRWGDPDGPSHVGQ